MPAKLYLVYRKGSKVYVSGPYDSYEALNARKSKLGMTTSYTVETADSKAKARTQGLRRI